MAELVDAQDLGSCVTDVGVQVPFPAPNFLRGHFFYARTHKNIFSFSLEDIRGIIMRNETCQPY